MSRTPGRRPLRPLTAAGLVLELGVVLVEVLTPGFDVPIAPLVLGPLLPATAGLLRATASLSALALVLAIAIIGARGDLGEGEELIRLLTVTAIGALAVVGTRLRRRLDELAQALDALPDAVTIQGPEGDVLYANRAADGLTPDAERIGLDSAAEYLRRMVVTFEDGTPVDLSLLPARRLLSGAPAPPVVLRSEDPATGRSTWSRVQASPLADAEGHVRSAVNVIEDVTDVKRREERAAFLAGAGALLASSLDTPTTLQRAAQLVVPGLADWCSVDLVLPGGRVELVALAHVDPAKVALGHELRERYPPDLSRDDGLGGVLRTGEPQLYPEIPAELLAQGAVDAEHLELLRTIGFSSALVVPLAIGPRVIGALTWVAAESGRRYDAEDLDTATQLAARAAVAVENARVHGERTEIASVLQRALLPTALPEAPGWELAAHHEAAGEANEVGGDLYDLVVLDDGALLALVGDVAGKGARAAALTARTRHTLVTAARLHGGDPAAGLTLLNRALQEEGGLELCSVALCLVRDDALTVVSAGHPLPLLLRGGTLTEVGRTAPMLGADPAACAWPAVIHGLEPGDTIVLHTDGVTDAVGAGERFGDGRLREAILDGPPGAGATVARIVERVEAFERGPQADDRALLVLHRTE